MGTFRIRTVIEADGELHLTSLPFQKGDQVEVIITPIKDDDVRADARRSFIEQANQSKFR
jgi:hypothetical protein